MSTKTKFWMIGILTVAVGLVLARVVSGIFAAQIILQLAIYFIGVALALGGLAVILFGIKKG